MQSGLYTNPSFLHCTGSSSCGENSPFCPAQRQQSKHNPLFIEPLACSTLNEEQPAIIYSVHTHSGALGGILLLQLRAQRKTEHSSSPQEGSTLRKHYWMPETPPKAQDLLGLKRAGGEFRDTQTFRTRLPPYRNQLGTDHGVFEPEMTITFFSEGSDIWGASCLPREGFGIGCTFQTLICFFWQKVTEIRIQVYFHHV